MDISENKLFKFSVVIVFGIAYVFLLNWIGRAYAIHFEVGPDSLSRFKILSTAICSILSLICIYSINYLSVKQNSLHVGISSACMAAVYFLIIRSDGLPVLEYILMIISTDYSLIAMIFFIGLPLLMGALLNMVES